MKPHHILLKYMVEDFLQRMAQSAGGIPLIPDKHDANLPDYKQTEDPSTEKTEDNIEKYALANGKYDNAAHYDEPSNMMAPATPAATRA